MSLDDIKLLLANLPEPDRQQVLRYLAETTSTTIATLGAQKSDEKKQLRPLEFTYLPQLLTYELKRQKITYEEMALQIGVSVSTFKRMIANPAAAKASNLHAVLNELGISIWLGK